MVLSVIKDINKYVEYFATLDKPIEYKQLQINLFKVKDYYDFMYAIDILTQEKNKIPDVKILQMSYLQYVTTVLFNENIDVIGEFYKTGSLWKYKFMLLLTKSFDCNEREIQFFVNNKGKVFLKIKGVEISAKEFNEIKDIILFGNFKDYEDESKINDDVKKALRDRNEILNKNKVYPSLEKQIMFVLRDSKINKSELLNMSYRDFNILYDISIEDREYILNNLRDMSGKTYDIKDKEALEHYMYKNKHNPYKDLFRNSDDVRNELHM
jgi:hypothetical protein